MTTATMTTISKWNSDDWCPVCKLERDNWTLLIYWRYNRLGYDWRYFDTYVDGGILDDLDDMCKLIEGFCEVDA